MDTSSFKSAVSHMESPVEARDGSNESPRETKREEHVVQEPQQQGQMTPEEENVVLRAEIRKLREEGRGGGHVQYAVRRIQDKPMDPIALQRRVEARLTEEPKTRWYDCFKSPAFYAILLVYLRLLSVLFSLAVSARVIRKLPTDSPWKDYATFALALWAVVGEFIVIVPSVLPGWLNYYPFCGVTLSNNPTLLDLFKAPWKHFCCRAE